jgi:acetyl-CoA carboxylase biotin carboxyl carrier protein
LLTFEQIKELVELVAQRRLQGLELERSGFRLKIDGQPQQQAVVVAPASGGAAAPAMPPTAAAVPMTATPSTPPSAGAPSAAAPEDTGHIINSPIVGTSIARPRRTLRRSPTWARGSRRVRSSASSRR